MRSEGNYKVKADAWGWSETTNGAPLFWMESKVIGEVDINHPDAALKPCEPGNARWSIAPSTPKSEDWLVRTVRALGYDRDDLLGLDPDRPEAFNFEGREFTVQCRHKEYQGQVREEWTVVTPRPKLANDKLAMLNERLAHKFAESKKVVVPSTTTPAADPKTVTC